MESQETLKSPIENLIEAARSGSEGALRQLHIGLGRKLVMVPIVRVDTAYMGASAAFFDPYMDGICAAYIMDLDKHGILPIFSSREFYDHWATSAPREIEGVPLFAADIARIVPISASIVLNFGTPLHFELSKEGLIQGAKGLWLGHEAGLYRELSLANSESDRQTSYGDSETHIRTDLLAASNRETETIGEYLDESEQSDEMITAHVLQENAVESASEEFLEEFSEGSLEERLEKSLGEITEPSIQKGMPRIGIDDIDFRRPDSSLQNPRSDDGSRPRLGTFTDILEVLRRYRQK